MEFDELVPLTPVDIDEARLHAVIELELEFTELAGLQQELATLVGESGEKLDHVSATVESAATKVVESRQELVKANRLKSFWKITLGCAAAAATIGGIAAGPIVGIASGLTTGLAVRQVTRKL